MLFEVCPAVLRCCIPTRWAIVAAVSWQYIRTAMCWWCSYWRQWPTYLCSNLSVSYSYWCSTMNALAALSTRLTQRPITCCCITLHSFILHC